MKSFRCLRTCVNKNILNAGTNLFWCCVIAVIFVPLESECNSGVGGYKKDKVVSSEITIQSNSLSFDNIGKNQIAPVNNATVKKEPERKLSSSGKNKSTNSTKVSQAKRQDIVYTFSSTFRPVPTSTKSPEKNVLSPSPIEMDLSYSSKEDENVSASSSVEDSSEVSSESPQSKEASPPHPQSKSAVPSLLFVTTLGTMGTSTMKSIQYFKTPSSAVLVTSSKKSTTKRPIRITSPRPPKKKRPPPSRNVIYHKGKRKPKPGRKPTTTSTSTTTPDPEEYDYEKWSSENSSGESTSTSTNTLKNSSSTSTTNSKMPLSKLAMAMIHTSSEFNNSGAGDKIYFPKTPVNLLNILQAYTKQIADNTPEGNQRPIVQIPNTPFMLNLNQLNFAAKVGISFYYSLIAIIPLVYLAFGGIGRLGILDAIVGRRLGRRKRRRKRSNEEQFYYGNGYNGSFPVNVFRSDYDNDEYAWIIGRISEIIIEMSLFPDSEMESND